MLLCSRVIIFTDEDPDPIQIEIDLPRPTPRGDIEEYLQNTYCDLLPEEGWVPRARIRHFGCETHLELIDRIWLLQKPQKGE